MAKIIQIENEVVTIGTDNGSIQEVRKSDCNFEPTIGDEVEVFSTETKTIVTKKEKQTQVSSNNDLQGGININVSNNNTVPASPLYVTNSKAVNKVLYCVLALFLGGIGVHKFYAGKTGAGILYLLFCWTYIPLVLSLIEFIAALCKPADVNGNILV